MLVPFSIEDGGRLGAHALSLLRALVVVAVDNGKTPPFSKRDSRTWPPTLISFGSNARNNASLHGFTCRLQGMR